MSLPMVLRCARASRTRAPLQTHEGLGLPIKIFVFWSLFFSLYFRFSFFPSIFFFILNYKKSESKIKGASRKRTETKKNWI